MTLLTNLQNIEENILDRNDSWLSEILLFGDSLFNDAKNASILNSTIQYIFDTKRFDVPLSVQMRENIDQKNSAYGHFSRSDIFIIYTS